MHPFCSLSLSSVSSCEPPCFFSDLAHPAVFVLSIDRFSFLGGIIYACCGIVPSPLYIDLTRASHRGIRLRRSLPLPQTDTRKNPIGGGKWVANLAIPTKATHLATVTAKEAGEPYGSALPSETQYCARTWVGTWTSARHLHSHFLPLVYTIRVLL